MQGNGDRYRRHSRYNARVMAMGDTAMDLNLTLYVCDAGHIHAVTKLPNGETIDTLLGQEEDCPGLKEICRDELGRFAHCPGAADAADEPKDRAQKIARLLDDYPEGDKAVKELTEASHQHEAALRQAQDIRAANWALLSEFNRLEKEGDEDKLRAFREQHGAAIHAGFDHAKGIEDAARAHMATVTQGLLTAPVAAKVSTDAEKYFPPDTTAGKALREGVSWLNGKIDHAVFNGEVVVKASKIPASQAQRDYYSHGEVYLSRNTNSATVVHETGHFLNDLPHVKEMALAFHEHRFGDEKQRPLKEVCPSCGYHSSEMGAKDSMERAFDEQHAYYVGKTYKDGQTEVVSMGMEKMVRDPAGFAVKDPEYFKFVMAVMHGKRLA